MTKNWKRWIAVSLFSLALGSFAAPRVFADDRNQQSGDNNQQCAPEPGWYLMMAAGAMVPATFYLLRRKEASDNR